MVKNKTQPNKIKPSSDNLSRINMTMYKNAQGIWVYQANLTFKIDSTSLKHKIVADNWDSLLEKSRNFAKGKD